MKKTILTYGTFDMFHIGHLKLLQRLSDLGDELIVAVSSDALNQLKTKLSIPKENILNVFRVIEPLKKDFE